MGTYTELTVAGYPLISSKSAVIPEVMTVFRETDRRVFRRRVADRNPLVWGEPDDPNNEEQETAVEYSCDTAKVTDRLNVMGFTLRRVQQEFEFGRRAEIEKYASWAEESDTQWFSAVWEFLEHLTFEQYASAYASIIARGLRPVPFDDYKGNGLDSVIKYMLGHNDDYLFGFPADDVRLILRLACEVAPAHSQVVQDITDLIEAGYYGDEEPVCSDALRVLTAGYPQNSLRVILTEGSSDAAILRETMALLYPHLSEYYSFLDFGSSRSQGGAGHLVSLVKAFAAAGVTNRIIALFDNDTAAREARRALDTVVLPPNIAVRAYPDLEFLRDYPTLGPGGLSPLDVNGFAASIELYLGEDVLRDDLNALTPVQWKGYIEPLKQYQGEVLRKSLLQSRFYDKLARCRAVPDSLPTTDWSGLSAILEMVFHAFD